MYIKTLNPINWKENQTELFKASFHAGCYSVNRGELFYHKGLFFFFYHFSHVLSDRFGSFHRVDGDSACLFYAELTFKAFLELHLSEVQPGVVMLFPL